MRIYAACRLPFSAGAWHRRTGGQAMTEYIVVVAAAIILLAAATAGNPSPVQQLIAALKGFWTHYSYLISLP